MLWVVVLWAVMEWRLCSCLVSVVSVILCFRSRVRSVGPKAAEGSVELIQSVPDGQLLRIPLVGDEFRLRQCLLNVCDNAVKYTRPFGEITLRLTRAEAPSPAELPPQPPPDAALGAAVEIVAKTQAEAEARDEIVWVEFEIEDTGVGISSTSIKELFAPFSQVPSYPFSRPHRPRTHPPLPLPPSRRSHYPYVSSHTAEPSVPCPQVSASSARRNSGTGLGEWSGSPPQTRERSISSLSSLSCYPAAIPANSPSHSPQ